MKTSDIRSQPVAAETRAGHTCPLCQTVMTNATDAAAAATWWRCTGCGQAWTASRLDVVAAYAQYVAAESMRSGGRPS